MYNQKHLLLQRFKEFYTGRVHPDADVKYDQVFLDIAAKFHVCFDALSLSALFIWQTERDCFISVIKAFDIRLHFIRIYNISDTGHE